MSINLEKGGKVDLTKGQPSGTNYMVGLGWDTNDSGSGSDFDLDAVALVLKGGKLVDDKAFVFYRNLTAHGLTHSGDNLTGKGDGDDETIAIKFPEVDGDEILFAVNIHEAKDRKQNFGQVKNSFIRIFNPDTKEEFFKYDLGEDFSTQTQVIMGKLYLRDGEWKFSANPEGFVGDLSSLLAKYQ